MNIFVTGATGFLGRHLCRRLSKDGHRVAEIDSHQCDLTKPIEQQIRLGFDVDVIFHLAAWTQAGDFCLHHPGEQWLINQKINTNVLDWWRQENPEAKLISIGSSCAYDPDGDMREENYLRGTPHHDLFAYATAKRMLHVGQLAMEIQYGMKSLTLAPATLYGVAYHTDERQPHFIFDIVRKILRGKQNAEPVILWGSGFQKRDAIHVGDFVEIAVQCLGTSPCGILNIGPGSALTIREYARVVCDLIGFESEMIQYDHDAYSGQKSKILDVGRLRRTFPGFLNTPLNIGLQQVIDWYKANPQLLAPKGE
jgi:GDP-L-fucose synthase